MNLSSLFTFTAFIFLTDGALKYCPREKCLPLRQCPSLWRAVQARIPRLLQRVRGAICGYQGLNAKVCCDVEGMPEHLVATGASPKHQMCLKDQHGNTNCRRRDESRRQEASALLPEVCGQLASFNRIFGGKHSELAAYPWIVAMNYTRLLDNATDVLCAGTLISERYVVTAAHCLDQNFTKLWKLSSLSLGDWKLSTDPDCSPQGVCAIPALQVSAERVLLHPSYNKEYRLSDDIALVRLDRAVRFTRFVQPMCLPPFILPRAEVAFGVLVTALGWGQYEDGVASDILREVQLSITSPLLCHKQYPGYFRINRAQLCLGGTVGMDTCSGDSGGPVVKVGSSGRLYLLALSSFGHPDCGLEGVPAVYTSVAHYASWIRDALSP